MDPTRKIVLFVNEGTWGDVSLERQDEGAEIFIHMLRPAAEVEVISSVAAAKELLPAHSIDAVVFRSRAMEDVARQIKDMYPRIRVVVLSALPPTRLLSDKIIWVKKTSIEDPADFARAVLG